MDKTIIPFEYSLMEGFCQDRLKANPDNKEIKDRIQLILKEIEMLKKIDLEAYDAIRNFAMDYD